MQTRTVYDGLGTLQSNAVGGVTAVKLLTTATPTRSAINICNASTSRYLWVVEQLQSAAAPTVSVNTATRIIAPRETVTLMSSGNIGYYGLFDDGAAGTDKVNVQELM